MASELLLAFFVVSIISGTWIISQIVQPQPFDSQFLTFDQWAQKYNKVYSSLEERAHRYQIFSANSEYIQSENLKGNTYTLSINEFADLTNLEFKSIHSRNSIVVEETQPQSISIQAVPEAAPLSVNWVTKGDVNAVVSEGQCGSASIFDAVDAVASAYAIANSQELPSLSYAQLEDCLGRGSGCSGSVTFDQIFAYIQSNGLELASSYPSGTGECQYDSNKVFTKITTWVDVKSNDNDALLTAVAAQPVAAYIEADRSAFQFYSSGVITGNACGTNVDHTVLIVGYGTLNGIDYWQVQNSWGTSWGESGYALIQRQAGKGAGVCGIATAPTYPII